jgi:hypothetical protein
MTDDESQRWADLRARIAEHLEVVTVEGEDYRSVLRDGQPIGRARFDADREGGTWVFSALEHGRWVEVGDDEMAVDPDDLEDADRAAVFSLAWWLADRETGDA